MSYCGNESSRRAVEIENSEKDTQFGDDHSFPRKTIHKFLAQSLLSLDWASPIWSRLLVLLTLQHSPIVLPGRTSPRLDDP
ncbi:hypothetical protein I7I50_04709 [Histoplasma capsulatum G186AR]|uniref:Uncharacterized protein n=1 Tax=Ajellomyces capsulatus TaxID=5037 RepID=A0A8H7YQW3_AJECA|nr:hypothetical protein I7I52_05618 [Histoplasma capsulatum]QSS75543.1 hypothetical protein I7I50_04709 [Histoplasma capsulatum G186AR]